MTRRDQGESTATDVPLEVVDVAFSYPIGPLAVDGLSLTVKRGNRLALLGGNGSGKSTLLLLMNGSLRPAAGELLLDGKPVSYKRDSLNALRRRVGLVLQDPDDQLFSASVFEDISFGPLNLGLTDDEARSRVETVVEELGLSELVDRPAHLLSFGQRKLVAIAGVAAMTPDVLLLDEPMAGLDPTSSAEVRSTLDRLADAGTTIVLTTHNVDLALSWATEVALMSTGKLLHRGPAWDVLHDESLCAGARLKRPSVMALRDALVASGTVDSASRPLDVAELTALLD